MAADAGKDAPTDNVMASAKALNLRLFFIYLLPLSRFLITFNFKGGTANAKSVLSVLGACIKSGDTIEFVCDGDDEEQALQAVVAAVESGLGE